MVKRKNNRVNSQFEFMPERSKIKPIFCARLLIKKYKEKKRKLTMFYIYLKSTYDRTLKKVLKK